MQLTITVLIIACLQVNATSLSAQNVSISGQDMSLKEVFHLIKKQTGYNFVYSDEDLKNASDVTLDVKNASLQEVLSICFADQPLTYSIYKKIIIIKPKPDLHTITALPNEEITGQVRDSATGEPLAGVSIQVKGTTKGTITDGSGKFRLEVPDDAVLQVSYLGYTLKEVSVNGATELNISLASSSTRLDQLVVVGYGTQKKSLITGSISTLKGEDLVKTKNENVVNELTGKVPGLRIVQKSAAPGDYDAAIDIRGMGTPLFVIDGVVRDQAYFSRMSPNVIENISVLKDGAASIYGMRAGNGVILVTTKRGQDLGGKVNITFNTNESIQQFLKVPNSVNAVDYMTLSNEKTFQDFNRNYLVRANPLFTQDQIQPYLNGEKHSYNWMQKVFRKSTPQYDQDLSIDGGGSFLRYYFNIDYSKQEGSYASRDYHSERWGLRSNIDATISKRLKAGISLGAIMVNTRKPNGVDWTAYKLTWLTRPDAPFYANDNPEYPNGNNQVLNDGNNEMVQTDEDYVGYNLNRDRRLNSTFHLEYSVPGIEGLEAKGMFDYTAVLPDYNNYKRAYNLYLYNKDDDSYSAILRNTPSSITKGMNFNFNTDIQLGLYYKNSFGKRHNVNGFALVEQTYNNWDGFSAFRELMVQSQYLFAGEEKNQQARGGDVGDRTNKAIIGSFSYNYASKYLFDFRFRYDGSSRFPEGSRFGFFPSFSAGWRLSEENFIKNGGLSFFSDLKLRASYGEMGDDASAGNYPPALGYQLDNNNYGWYFGDQYTGGVSPTNLPNPDLTWYKIKSYNIGLDFGIFHDMLSGSFDLFKRDRSGLLATSDAVIPGTVGASLPQENLNADRNFGYEISLEHRNVIGAVTYYVKGQISATKYMHREWLETPASNSYDRWRNRTSGRYGNIWWGDESEGMFTSLEQIRDFDKYPMGQGALPGDWYLDDWNEDGVIDANDDHPIATLGLPEFNYGFSIEGNWKGIDLTLNFQGVHGVYVQYSEVLVEALPFGGQNTLTWFMDRWHPADPDADYFSTSTKWNPGYYPVTGHDGRRTGTNGIQNSSYMRLKTAEIGYSLPDELISKAGIKGLRFYLSGYNLLTFTKLKGADPERPGGQGGASTNFIDFYNYPVNRTFSVGLTIKL